MPKAFNVWFTAFVHYDVHEDGEESTKFIAWVLMTVAQFILVVYTEQK